MNDDGDENQESRKRPVTERERRAAVAADAPKLRMNWDSSGDWMDDMWVEAVSEVLARQAKARLH